MTQINIVSKYRQVVRSKITPYRQAPEDKTFVVGWEDKPQTFEQITDALRPELIKALLYYKRVERQYIGDMLQQGWLRLWEELIANKLLLAELPRVKAMDFVANRCGASKLHDYLNRYDSYHTSWKEEDSGDYEESFTEIVTGSSLKSHKRGVHAAFTEQADYFIDITTMMEEIVVWCDGDIRKLAALYYLTTSVTQVDAGRIAGFEIKIRSGRVRCVKMDYWTKIVLKKLREVFDSYKPVEPDSNDWRRQLKAENFQPLKQLAKQYNSDKLLALYTLTTSVSLPTLLKDFGVGELPLRYQMELVRHDLRNVYAKIGVAS